jgi:YidC/Oxa1 family membrane protein insertase
MEFDKNTVLAFILIAGILIFINTDFYHKRFFPSPKPLVSDENIKKVEPAVEPSSPPLESTREAESIAETPSTFSRLTGSGESVLVETDFYNAIFSTQGATIRSWTLKNYLEVDKSPVQLVGEDGYGNLALLLPNRETAGFEFSVNKKEILLNEASNSDSLVFTLNLDERKEIRKTYIFYHDRYDIDLKVELKNIEELVEGFSYYLTWRSGLNSTEPDLEQDMSKSHVYAYQTNLEKFDASDKFDPSQWDNPTDWVAIRTKYFSLAVIPRGTKAQGVKFSAEKKEMAKNVFWKKYSFDLEMPFKHQNYQQDLYKVYLGPLDYEVVSSYNVNLEDMMDLGWAWFRPFGKAIIWCFVGLHKLAPNYGWVIIIFTVLIKLLLFPLTKKSFQSMKEMQALQPLMQEINEKYKNDPQKKQQEMMTLYKQYGINPFGGCLPMLLQMPLLIALFQVFQSTIELRQAEFIWWIKDLSLPDTVALLPFSISIPLYGNKVNVLPLFMGITMFIQQKMTMKDPKQKAMVYFMPIFFTLLFNGFPSGLNLYYAFFNVLSILQDKLLPYKPKSLEELKARTTQKKRIKHDYRGRLYKG